MAKGRDATDLLCYRWAATRRQLLGLANPRTQKEFIGAIRCTLGTVQQHRDGAASFTAREQRFPEVYTGTSLIVNLAVKQMEPKLRDVMDLHYCLGRGACKRADLLGIPRRVYWDRLARAKRYVEGFLAGEAHATSLSTRVSRSSAA